jgi:hypothetical protein
VAVILKLLLMTLTHGRIFDLNIPTLRDRTG